MRKSENNTYFYKIYISVCLSFLRRQRFVVCIYMCYVFCLAVIKIILWYVTLLQHTFLIINRIQLSNKGTLMVVSVLLILWQECLQDVRRERCGNNE